MPEFMRKLRERQGYGAKRLVAITVAGRRQGAGWDALYLLAGRLIAAGCEHDETVA
jgi:hypothetical protein